MPPPPNSTEEYSDYSDVAPEPGALIMTKFEEKGWCRGLLLESKIAEEKCKITVLYEDEDAVTHSFPAEKILVCKRVSLNPFKCFFYVFLFSDLIET